MTELLSWIISASGPVGIALAIYFYSRTRNVSRISYEIKETTVVGSLDAAFTSDMKISFRDIDVPRVTSTRLTLWNSGSVTIRHADVVADDPLALVLIDGTCILQTTVERRSRPVNGVSLSNNVPQRVAIEFNFLEPGDGFIVSIIHTAEKSRSGLTGTIIGYRSGFKDIDSDKNYMIDMLTLAIQLFSIPILLTASVMWARDHTAAHYLISTRGDSTILLLSMGVAFFAFVSVLQGGLNLGWRRKPKSLSRV